MRILMLAQFYHPIIGGEERMVQDLSIELVRRGHQVAVATLWHNGLSKYEVDQGVQIFRVRGTAQRIGWLYTEKKRRHAPPWPDPEVMLSMNRILAGFKPDVVHAHNWFAYSFLPLKPFRRAQFVMTLHDYGLACTKRRLVYKGRTCSGPRLDKCLRCASEFYGLPRGIPTVLGNNVMSKVTRQAVDMFLPISMSVARGNGLLGNGLPYQVIPNFVPDRKQVNSEDSNDYIKELPNGDYILFVGDLSHDKGVDVLLDAYAMLDNAPPLVLIGRECPDTPHDVPPNVMRMGMWPHAAVTEAWRRCMIGVVPSTWAEPFGVVAIEAMTAGKPVIASDTGGLSDIVVHGETGLLVPPNDAKALKLTLQLLLSNAVMRAEMGQAGQQRVEQFRASTVVPRIEAVYEKVINSAKL